MQLAQKFKLLSILSILISLTYANDTHIRIDENLERLYGEDVRFVGLPRVYNNGILFTYAAGEDQEVLFAADFLDWEKPRVMFKNDFGVQYLFVPLDLAPGTYRYRFRVDGLWLNDPGQEHLIQDPFGAPMSALLIEETLETLVESPKPLGKGKYLFFLKDEGFNSVSFVGTLNKWDPYSLYMSLERGYWRLELEIEPGQQAYRFRVDGEEILDPKNVNQVDLPFGDRASYLELSVD